MNASPKLPQRTPLHTLLTKCWPESLPCGPYPMPPPATLDGIRTTLSALGQQLDLARYGPLQRMVLGNRRGDHLRRALFQANQRLQFLGERSAEGPSVQVLLCKPVLVDLLYRERRHRRILAEARLLHRGIEDALLLTQIALDLLSERVLSSKKGPPVRRGFLPEEPGIPKPPVYLSQDGFWSAEVSRFLAIPANLYTVTQRAVRTLWLQLGVPPLRPFERQILNEKARSSASAKRIDWSTALTRSSFGEVSADTAVTPAMLKLLLSRHRKLSEIYLQTGAFAEAALDTWLLCGAFARSILEDLEPPSIQAIHGGHEGLYQPVHATVL